MSSTTSVMMHVPVDSVDIVDAPGPKAWTVGKIVSELRNFGCSKVAFTLQSPASDRTFRRELIVTHVLPGPIDLWSGPAMVYVEVEIDRAKMTGTIYFLHDKPFGSLYPMS